MITAPATTERMAAAATAWLASLEPEQRARACSPADDDDERRRFFYTPNQRGGLPLIEMNPRQRQLATALLASGLSVAGYNTASTVIGLELALDALEGFRERPYPQRAGVTTFRDPQMYFVTVFGAPGGREPWGWRWGGHHVCVQYAIVGNTLSATPTFIGANPIALSLGETNVIRPLAEVEDRARALVGALDEPRSSSAIISPHAPEDLTTQNAPRLTEGLERVGAWRMMGNQDNAVLVEGRRLVRERLGLTAEDDDALRFGLHPAGLPVRAMTAAQRDLLTALVRAYLDRMPDEVAASEATRLAGEVLDEVHFAWAGSIEPGQPHYYRVQGPRLFIEYDNTQNDVNHIHSIWRDPEGDFGGDLLAQHYARAHAG